jgi:hypothetical protein
MTLEAEFQSACQQAVEECKRLAYPPRDWIRMMNAPGGAVAGARRLLSTGHIQSGFERLILMGRPDLTVEAAVLDPRWHELFSDAHREAARWRLSQALGKPLASA